MTCLSEDENALPPPETFWALQASKPIRRRFPGHSVRDES